MSINTQSKEQIEFRVDDKFKCIQPTVRVMVGFYYRYVDGDFIPDYDFIVDELGQKCPVKDCTLLNRPFKVGYSVEYLPSGEDWQQFPYPITELMIKLFKKTPFIMKFFRHTNPLWRDHKEYKA